MMQMVHGLSLALITGILDGLCLILGTNNFFQGFWQSNWPLLVMQIVLFRIIGLLFPFWINNTVDVNIYSNSGKSGKRVQRTDLIVGVSQLPKTF